MRKWIALLLAAIMLVACTGCSFMEDFQEGFEEGLNDALQNAAQKANKEIIRGSIDGNVYTSEYSGLTFTKPDSWAYATDEEIAETLGIGSDILSDTTKFAEAVAQMATVYDMMVVDGSTGSSITVAYENLKISNGGDMTAEDYMNTLKSQLSSLTDMNYVVKGDVETVALSGNDYLRLSCSVEYEGFAMQQIYYARNLDSVMSVLIATLIGDQTAADIEAMFS